LAFRRSDDAGVTPIAHPTQSRRIWKLHDNKSLRRRAEATPEQIRWMGANLITTASLATHGFPTKKSEYPRERSLPNISAAVSIALSMTKFINHG